MGFTSSDLPAPTSTKDLIDPLSSPESNSSGFQRAHIVGEAFANDPRLSWFRWVLGSKAQNSRVNGVLAPQAHRGGAILGVAVHNLNHVAEFNTLFFDVNSLENSDKWMNVTRVQLRARLQGVLGNDFNIDDPDHFEQLRLSGLDQDPSVKSIFDEYHKKTAAFLDFAKILFLHDEHLEKLGYDGLKSLALNDQDVRYGTNEAVRSYIAELEAENGGASIFDYDEVEKEGSLYSEIAKVRDQLILDDFDPDSSVGRAEFERRMIAKHPTLSRIFYPNGVESWTREGAVAMGGIGAVVGMANFAFSAGDWRRQVYSDHLLPWMTYMFRPDEDGNLDMFVTNQFDQLFQAVFGGTPSEQYEKRLALARQGILDGWMKIENVDVVGSILGIQQLGLAGKADLNMVFRAANPIWAANENECALDAREAA